MPSMPGHPNGNFMPGSMPPNGPNHMPPYHASNHQGMHNQPPDGMHQPSNHPNSSNHPNHFSNQNQHSNLPNHMPPNPSSHALNAHHHASFQSSNQNSSSSLPRRTYPSGNEGVDPDHDLLNDLDINIDNEEAHSLLNESNKIIIRNSSSNQAAHNASILNPDALKIRVTKISKKIYKNQQSTSNTSSSSTPQTKITEQAMTLLSSGIQYHVRDLLEKIVLVAQHRAKNLANEPYHAQCGKTEKKF